MKLMDSALGTETLAQLLVRDNALVFAMEHVRIIIMHDKVRRGAGGGGSGALLQGGSSPINHIRWGAVADVLCMGGAPVVHSRTRG